MVDSKWLFFFSLSLRRPFRNDISAECLARLTIAERELTKIQTIFIAVEWQWQEIILFEWFMKHINIMKDRDVNIGANKGKRAMRNTRKKH